MEYNKIAKSYLGGNPILEQHKVSGPVIWLNWEDASDLPDTPDDPRPSDGSAWPTKKATWQVLSDHLDIIQPGWDQTNGGVVSKVKLLMLFQDGEQDAIYDVLDDKTSPLYREVRRIWNLLVNSQTVDLGDPIVQAMIKGLEQMGLIGKGRAVQIIAGQEVT